MSMPDAIQPTLLQKLNRTPMRDLVRGRITSRLDYKTKLAAADLPDSIKSLIQRVVRKTKLWSLEKADVANELIAHFIDGLDSGASAGQLIESFGDQRQAARLIRRAKKRNRPIVWHIFRAIFRAVGLLVVIYLGMTGYFFMGRPSPKTDYIAILNGPMEKVPLDQRAWPLYRQVILNVGMKSNDDIAHLSDLLLAKPDSGKWPAARDWVQAHQSDLKLIREAAEKPIMGFVLGPHGSAYDPQLWSFTQNDSSLWSGSLISVLLPYLNDLRILTYALDTDAKLACQQGDSQRFMQDITAMIHMADQIQGHDFLVTDLVAIGLRSQGVDEIDAVLIKFPSLLSDAELQQLAHRLAKPDNDSELINFHGEQFMFRDLLQRMYTDDGSGNGRFTPTGIEFLQSLGTPHDFQPPQSPALKLAGPMMMLAASRKDLLDADDALINFADANLHRPLRDADWSAYQQRVDQMRSSLIKSIRYALVLVIAPSLERTQWTAERYLGRRDGVLVALALEVYRRHNGHYPQTLNELTPLLLPSVPSDRITGEPVHYRIVDEQPIVYSVGVDRKDDGGRPPKIVGNRSAVNDAAKWNIPKGQFVPDGDWILYPQTKFDVDDD
jgi:hypothetical protein